MIAISCQFFAVLSRVIGIRRLLVGFGYHNARHESAMKPIGYYLSYPKLNPCKSLSGASRIIINNLA